MLVFEDVLQCCSPKKILTRGKQRYRETGMYQVRIMYHGMQFVHLMHPVMIREGSDSRASCKLRGSWPRDRGIEYYSYLVAAVAVLLVSLFILQARI